MYIIHIIIKKNLNKGKYYVEKYTIYFFSFTKHTINLLRSKRHKKYYSMRIKQMKINTNTTSSSKNG